jgi:hypothetical protein
LRLIAYVSDMDRHAFSTADTTFRCIYGFRHIGTFITRRKSKVKQLRLAGIDSQRNHGIMGEIASTPVSAVLLQVGIGDPPPPN